ncbi:hypothetical protein KAFR_0C04380 [Kazachstania africana CBS 2517]|uniref:N-acetyltransferase ECO1 n=1 Tax=Kazachstania africana (strain ATCC 22294 / BCRC 22015 / CBS 2517 / CECT 1963 / NBRC 1671 / NRRL Y-8276) TaxID=1071382 RepID=H2ASS8_KAZAF|nr:hypothetical protein KAFR_0C04380 [Kazachstania africana CBS 2517]CCF57428.1 hypothetical protein KAFR_0C04380 [Kazachstania africana CBS 2517]
MANTKIHRTRSTKYTQAHLNLCSKTSKLTKCPKCEMTYSTFTTYDTLTHRKYHDLHLKGKKWNSNWGKIVWTSAKSNERIVMIRPSNNAEVKATLEIMDIVNEELNAPHDENYFWSDEKKLDGKAFLYIKNDRAVGVVIIEGLQRQNEARGRWMIYDTREIVPNVFPEFVYGISRIWVCKNQRLNGIAFKLLELSRENLIYGRVIDKHLIAWSQPTDDGGKLASRFNSVTHKSGKLLLPCYI